MRDLRGPPKVFVLGSFRNVDARRKSSLRRLRRLVTFLRWKGYDAFISGDARSVELAKGAVTPRQATEDLEARCDVALFVGSIDGRADGWVSELTALQLLRPGSAGKRLLLLQARYPLSSMLSPQDGGYLSTPPVAIAAWQSERDLLDVAARHLGYYVTYAGFPQGRR